MRARLVICGPAPRPIQVVINDVIGLHGVIRDLLDTAVGIPADILGGPIHVDIAAQRAGRRVGGVGHFTRIAIEVERLFFQASRSIGGKLDLRGIGRRGGGLPRGWLIFKLLGERVSRGTRGHRRERVAEFTDIGVGSRDAIRRHDLRWAAVRVRGVSILPFMPANHRVSQTSRAVKLPCPQRRTIDGDGGGLAAGSVGAILIRYDRLVRQGDLFNAAPVVVAISDGVAQCVGRAAQPV
ncbi:hypothetical protein PHO31112_05411 [Pandoraea horticolens]|uniref:Uncharacterized protein n=1 Tax=Pandoraea horticolens TaxID=2508298 RepID=A0A5E4ZCB0_9BURK|nr:hypothetical protein PHO31112_05411 [Pandoraea horticolens]